MVQYVEKTAFLYTLHVIIWNRHVLLLKIPSLQPFPSHPIKQQLNFLVLTKNIFAKITAPAARRLGQNYQNSDSSATRNKHTLQNRYWVGSGALRVGVAGKY